MAAPRLKDKYTKEIVPALKQKFNYKSVMQVPKIEKICINKGMGVAVSDIQSCGFNGDATEAEAWAYLAVRSLKGLPITFPMTTGVSTPMTGGVLHQTSTRAA